MMQKCNAEFIEGLGLSEGETETFCCFGCERVAGGLRPVLVEEEVRGLEGCSKVVLHTVYLVVNCREGIQF